MALVLENGKWLGVDASDEFRQRAKEVIMEYFGVWLHVHSNLRDYLDSAAEQKKKLRDLKLKILTVKRKHRLAGYKKKLKDYKKKRKEGKLEPQKKEEEKTEVEREAEKKTAKEKQESKEWRKMIKDAMGNAKKKRRTEETDSDSDPEPQEYLTKEECSQRSTDLWDDLDPEFVELNLSNEEIFADPKIHEAFGQDWDLKKTEEFMEKLGTLEGLGGCLITPAEPHVSIVAGVMEWLSIAVKDPRLMRRNDKGMKDKLDCVSFATPNLAFIEGDTALRVKIRNLIRGEHHYMEDMTDADNLNIDRIFKARRIPAVGTPTYGLYNHHNDRAPYYQKPHIECADCHCLLALLAMGYRLCSQQQMAAEGWKTEFSSWDIVPHVLRAPDRFVEQAERKRSANPEKYRGPRAVDDSSSESEEAGESQQ